VELLDVDRAQALDLPVRALLAAAAACPVVDARSGDVWPYTGAGRSVTMSGGEVRGMAYKLRWTIAMTILGLAAALPSSS
jgi:hypothetical protein